jgi:hypothetical protein
MKPVGLVGGFNDTAGIAFSSHQNDEKLHIGSPVFISKESHEESHCQASKRPNRCFVNARYVWVEGITTFEESLYQAAKMPNRSSVNIMEGGTHAPSGILQSTEKYKFLKNPCTFRQGVHGVQCIVFLAHKNSDYALTVSHVTLSRRSYDY